MLSEMLEKLKFYDSFEKKTFRLFMSSIIYSTQLHAELSSILETVSTAVTTSTIITEGCYCFRSSRIDHSL